MTTGRLPDTYLIGAPKAGTTSLADWLAQHDQVYFSVPKEPFYWAADYPGMRARYGFDTAEAYAALFAGPEAYAATRIAEGSTTYLYSERAVPDIVAAGGEPRFIVSLRRPADLLVSYHRTQLVALNEDEPDFERAWRRSLRGEGPGVTPVDPNIVDYPRIGRLGSALERLYAVVPRHRVHVVLFDELAADPGAVWRSLTGFLDLRSDPAPDFAVRNASTKAARSASLRRFMHTPPPVLAGPIRTLRHWSRTTSNPLVGKFKSALWRDAAHPSVTAEVKAEVSEYFAADTALAAELTGLDLSAWIRLPSR
ncbi:MAG: hypothetical protein M3513_00785 [Actinomycetota bacterium]|nr:hypothetical protein [Actinomycetota bacterium]